jgi:hypothetical protein
MDVNEIVPVSVSLGTNYLLVLSTLPPVPVAEGAGISFLVRVRFPAAAAVMPVALLTAFLTVPALRMIVVWALESEVWLLWLAVRPRPTCLGGTGGGAIAPARPPLMRIVPVFDTVCLLAVRDDAVAADLPNLWFSFALTRLASEAVAAATVPDLMGETGRVSPDFPGDASLTGDCGYVRELCDFGESTFDGSTLRDTARAFATAGAAATGAAFARFLGRSRSPACMFSLSDWSIWSELWCVSTNVKRL